MGILDALKTVGRGIENTLGQPAPQYQTDPNTGAITPVQQQGTLGGVLKNVLSNFALGAGGGPGAVVNRQQEQAKQAFEQARESSQNQQATQQAADEHTVHQAQIASYNIQNATAAHNLDIAKQNDFYNEEEKKQTLRKTDLDWQKTITDMGLRNGTPVDDYIDLQNNPDMTKKLQSNQALFVPNYDPAHPHAGTIYDLPQNLTNTPNANPISVDSYSYDAKAKKIVLTHQGDIDAGKGTQAQVLAVQQAKDKSLSDALKNQHEQAGTENEKAQTVKNYADVAKTYADTAKIKSETGMGDMTDSFGTRVGVTPEGQQLPLREYNTRVDKFGKDYVQPLTVLQKTTMEFNRINSNPNQTGAEKVTALLNAVGISGDPLKGKGFRISNDIINEHAQARNIWQGAVQKLNTIAGSGGPITSQQISDYTNVALGVVHDAYVTAAQEARRQGVPVNFLPKATKAGAQPDAATAKIYLDAAGGDVSAAYKAMVASGFAK